MILAFMRERVVAREKFGRHNVEIFPPGRVIFLAVQFVQAAHSSTLHCHRANFGADQTPYFTDVLSHKNPPRLWHATS
jgi:hypothetical protein